MVLFATKIKEVFTKKSPLSKPNPQRASFVSTSKPSVTRQTYSQSERNRTTSTSPMVKILETSLTPPEVGNLVDGKVINSGKTALFIDLPPFGTGIIYGREFMNARDIIKKIHAGDTVTAKIVERENDDGYIELSLREARQALIWSEAEEAINNKTVFELPVKEANKGGLIISWQGISGFLPASQLKQEHYPRVEDGNKDRVLEELHKLVGTKLYVCIISAIPQEEKLIFSEKSPRDEKKDNELVLKYAVGDVVEGEITGVVDFGLFIKVEEGLEGLVHISEMDWGLVENPREMFKVGETIKAKVIEVKEGKISLSIKRFKPNPWDEAKKKYETGETVRGVVIKHNKHGALISIDEGIAGLVHISEFGDEKNLRETLELGKSYDFKITLFEPDEQRLTFSYKDALEKKEID